MSNSGRPFPVYMQPEDIRDFTKLQRLLAKDHGRMARGRVVAHLVRAELQRRRQEETP